MAATLRALGLVPIGGNYRTVWGWIKRLGLDTSRWHGQGWRKGVRKPIVAARPLVE